MTQVSGVEGRTYVDVEEGEKEEDTRTRGDEISAPSKSDPLTWHAAACHVRRITLHWQLCSCATLSTMMMMMLHPTITVLQAT